MNWSTDRWIGIASIVSTLIASLFIFSPFRRYVEQFNDWYDANDRERVKRRLAYVKAQLKDLREGTTHIHFQKCISAGLLALTLVFGLVFLQFILHRGDPGSSVMLIFMGLSVAVWQFGSAFRRLKGIREQELVEKIAKLETQLDRFKRS